MKKTYNPKCGLECVDDGQRKPDLGNEWKNST